MSDNDSLGRPAEELSVEELEQQGKHAHETRNWVFLHGSAEQFARHTSRMLELEREYIRRFPKRTWQGSGGARGDAEATAEAWRETVRGIIRQLESLVAVSLVDVPTSTTPPADPERAFLQRIADAGGHLHRLEAHQAAREVGLERSRVANLYKADPPLITTQGENRILTDAGRARLAEGAP
jgi:hypothetical protein